MQDDAYSRQVARELVAEVRTRTATGTAVVRDVAGQEIECWTLDELEEDPATGRRTDSY